MRLAFNGAFLDEGHHGTGTYTRGLLRSLVAQKHPDDEIIVYACSGSEVPNGSRVWWKPSPRFLTASQGSLANASRFFWMQTALPLRLKRDSVDVVLSPIAEGMLFATARQVVLVYDLIPVFYPEENPRLHLYFKHVLPFILKKARKVVTVSEHARRDIVSHFGVPAEKVAVVYGGIEPLYFSANEDQLPSAGVPEDYFLFVGTFSPRKNLGAIIRAFAQIHKEIPHKLLVVARKDRRFAPGLLSLAQKLGVLHKITILSNLSTRELLFVYRRACSLLLLSEYEGFGYPPLEAMAVGTPAIVSEGTAVAEVVADAAITVASDNVLAISDSMRNLALQQDLRWRYSRLGLNHSRQFHWGAAAEKMRAVLNEVIRT